MRHTFNISLLYSLPYGRGRKFGSDASAVAQALLGGWEVGGIVNARSGMPDQRARHPARHPLPRHRDRASSTPVPRPAVWR